MLQEQIKALEERYQHAIKEPKLTVWTVAARYFRLLESDVSSADASNFMQAAMTPHVTDGLLCGAEALLENRRQLSLCFGSIDTRAKCLLATEGGSLVAITTTTITLPAETIQRVFPHLTSVEDWKRQLVSPGFQALGSACCSARIGAF
ncbi:unnamed protein product [Phytophthora lilii]|uniref:Unnamed protein product n=1 Tax=Phytophthora lilii TaxID=2077276 RepID=A0A9W6XHT9_9STRA|nr:unnamed protein product [Phytophthora lilii]